MASRGISIDEGNQRISQVISRLVNEFASIRGGRVIPSLIENILVEAYNGNMQLKQLANISVADASTMVVKLWDINLVKAVEKAIRLDERGFSLRIDGTTIFVQSPPLTEERRKEYVKVAKDMAEEAKQSLRDIRNKLIDGIEEDKDLKLIGEDEEKRLKDKVEKMIKDAASDIEQKMKEKEQDLMSI